MSELDRLGVFDGTLCGGGSGFCPDTAIDRKTMAVWIVRILDGQDPAPVTAIRFNDVDADGFYASFIERMADLGVTRGCGDGSGFCPDQAVNRAQMAAFLSRSYELPDGPDGGGAPVIIDDALGWSDPDRLRNMGAAISAASGQCQVIILTCTPGRYTNIGKATTARLPT